MLLNICVKAKVLVGGLSDRIRDRVMDETGAVSAEYGLLIVLIALVMAIGATILGNAIKNLFTDTATSIGH